MALRRPLWVFLPLQAAVFLYALDLLPIWGDEQFTLDVIALPWAQIPARMAQDVHPPLYYFLLKLWATLTPFLDPLIGARALSVVYTLAATWAMDRLFLRERSPQVRSSFLALWSLAPFLLLYSRMARAYSLQILLACLAVAAGLRVIEAPTLRRTAIFSISAAALLWTHYLPGLAIATAVGLVLLFRSWPKALLAGVMTTALYTPWLAVLADALTQASERHVYQLSSAGWMEHGLRIAYTAVSFSSGEAHSALSPVLAAVAAAALFGFAFLGAARDSTPLPMIFLASCVIGYLGAASWVSYSFMPARLPFLLPFLFLFAAMGISHREFTAALFVLFAVFNAQYFFGGNLLNKGYLIPYGEIAETIRKTSPSALVIADAVNGDPAPLVAVLRGRYPLLVAKGDDFPRQAAREIARTSPQRIWYLRTSRDITPGRLHEKLEEDLQKTYRASVQHYLPYNAAERFALRAMTGAEPPTHHYQALLLTKE